jgi:hypothetical protein
MRSPARVLLVLPTLAAIAAATLTGVTVQLANADGSAAAAPAAGTGAATTVPAPATHEPTPARASATAGLPVTSVQQAGAGRSAEAPGPARDGDVDGDGQADQIVLPEPGTVRVRYSAGGSQDVQFETDSAVEPILLGVVDADWDGHAEVFIRAIAGASTKFASLFRYTDGRLQLVTLNGGQALLGYGGTVTHQDSWTCRPPQTPILTWTGTSSDGRTFHGIQTSYQFRGAALIMVSSRPRTVTLTGAAPSGCGSLTLP